MWNSSQPLFWYKPLFMLQLLIIEIIFSLKLRPRNGLAWRMPLAIAVCLGFSVAIPTFYNAVYSMFMFLGMFAVSICALKFVYDESFKNILFYGIIGYTVQHISSEIFELFNIVANVNGNLVSDVYGSGTIDLSTINWFVITLYIWIYGMVYWGAYMLVGRNLSKFGGEKLTVSVMFSVGGVIMLIDVIFSSIITYAIPANADRLAVSMLHVYNIVCCVLAIIISFVLPRHISLENELNVVRQINYKEKKQYEVSTENMNLINFKCHDLKHQIRNLTLERSVDPETIQEIENLIGDYDAVCKTGNSALNVVLTEKSLLCKKFQIRFVCIADGEKLSFMKDSDLYALFGNMLDNAMEAVRSFPEDERTVSLTVKAVGSFVIISLRNRYKGELTFKNDLPETTKKNAKEFHGFGMKSMQYTVRQYGGEMSVVASDGYFNLNIAFALESESASTLRLENN